MKASHAATSLAVVALAGSALAQLAPLEHPSGVYFGAWLDSRPGFDSPQAFNKRVGHNAAFFQLAYDFPLNFNTPPPVEILDYTQTDALLYVTIYPKKDGITNMTGNQALQQFTDADVAELVKQLVGFVVRGRKVFVRLFPEMNGSWNPWGQRPVAYTTQWRRIVNAVRSSPALPADRKDWIAFVWAPSAAVTRGGGYPFSGGDNTPFTPNTGTLTSRTAANATEFAALDTNKDGNFNEQDDPYSPYYPGNEYVDWVGSSIYYYGNTWPWEKNELPVPTSFVEQLTGTPPNARSINFYDVYASRNNKPMMLVETNAAFHEYLLQGRAAVDPGPGELAIKQAFWKQYMTSPSFLSTYNKIKAICLFEFQKDEETTHRDFQITNDSIILAAFKKDFEVQDVYSKYIFGNCSAAAGAQLVNCTADAGPSSQPTTTDDNAAVGSDGKKAGGGSTSAGVSTSVSAVFMGVLSVAAAGLWAWL
ncbi:hypothetical protein HK097_009488 [Rhizophlyctis rosea]|uniref:GH26 domain-containing protein n=1 Tax=Rhizophlyctis rosea TaxID=64517 RepID=A0AAD5S8W6_9FUNG|nr:hypothetical protein HK097_009488 [Rhizophlyctis rosea]